MNQSNALNKAFETLTKAAEGFSLVNFELKANAIIVSFLAGNFHPASYEAEVGLEEFGRTDEVKNIRTILLNRKAEIEQDEYSWVSKNPSNPIIPPRMTAPPPPPPAPNKGIKFGSFKVKADPNLKPNQFYFRNDE